MRDINMPTRLAEEARASFWKATLKVSAISTCIATACMSAIYGPLLGFAVAEGDLCPDPDLASDMRFLSVGLALIGLLSPIVILCGCMLPITLCLGDISESKVQRYFFILRLLGNGVLFGWSIYGMSFVYTNPLIDTCLDPVRTYTFVMMIINLVGWSLLCCCNCLVLVLDAM
ncbi:hypothetical protein FNF27_04921 [Cafeteria roenbergensis]|uniref:Uncharacterized protein n=1 Tax=Cafeteria roenbergensis TaxID=33653 RepID=A0A5A8C667_CAFRO|nr:hypothetical protein FNF31_07469 [Cafeteria roenbergensis]KAA0152842.1 hypothetical protein FNF28_07002 [Cafeteria roenbergensis]KAA0173587.1 hypothetical protein FNF27_04921 [Cafeteria roenbergensis]